MSGFEGARRPVFRWQCMPGELPVPRLEEVDEKIGLIYPSPSAS